MRDYLFLREALQLITDELGYAWPAKAVIEAPREAGHGDMATNLAMVLSKEAHLAPRQLAQILADKLRLLRPDLQVEIAGPGFLNMTFAPAFWQKTVLEVEKAGADYGRTNAGAGRKVLLEFVSANPTGPLHVGHGRGAAVGDTLGRILRFAGFDVVTEYYTNDAGRQMRLLGLSVYLRLREAAQLPVSWPDDYYKGGYIRDIALELLKARPELPRMPAQEAEDICFEYAVNSILGDIKDDLRTFRVSHDIWFSERSLVDRGLVEETLNWLKKEGRAYEQDGALWFRSTRYGDDKDRVLRKSDGSLTYFASDIAYHNDKFKRGHEELINVLGADHHGYVPRMKAAIAALGHNPETDFDVVLIQLVNLLRNGEQVAMSTRSGEFDTLAEVVAEVGVDAARFMFLSRKSDSPLDFDLELVKQRNMDNPVYYVQYAHARIATLLRRAGERGISLPARSTPDILAPLTGHEDIALLRSAERFADTVREAALAKGVHGISYYLMDLSGKLHSYYANTPILGGGDEALTLARLCMLRSVGQVLVNGLELLGVEAPGNM